MPPTIRMMIDRTDGEDRPVDEEMGKTHWLAEARLCLAWRRRLISPFCGTTLAPGRTIGLASPSSTTLSVGARPSRTTRRPSTSGPSVTGLACTTLSSPTVNTILRAWSETTAESGISRASYSPPNSCTRPKMPGVRSWSLLSTMARVRMVPERGLERVVDEVDLAGARPFGLVGQADAHRDRRIARPRPRARQEEARVAQVVGLRDVEHEADRDRA